MSKSIILKLGGSLIHHSNGEILRRIGKIIAQYSAIHSLLIVPGGGPFADLVRQYGTQLELSEQTCHFMALSAMDEYAYILREFIPGSSLTDLSNISIKSSTPAIHPNLTGPQILLCSQFLKQIPTKELPHSWNVTSDSIAAYLAKQLDYSLLVLLKSTDINPGIEDPDVDPFFHQLLPLDMPVWFINGIYPERLARFFETGSTQGICLPPNAYSGQLVF